MCSTTVNPHRGQNLPAFPRHPHPHASHPLIEHQRKRPPHFAPRPPQAPRARRNRSLQSPPASRRARRDPQRPPRPQRGQSQARLRHRLLVPRTRHLRRKAPRAHPHPRHSRRKTPPRPQKVDPWRRKNARHAPRLLRKRWRLRLRVHIRVQMHPAAGDRHRSTPVGVPLLSYGYGVLPRCHRNR
jgi:hypothetical protein